MEYTDGDSVQSGDLVTNSATSPASLVASAAQPRGVSVAGALKLFGNLQPAALSVQPQQQQQQQSSALLTVVTAAAPSSSSPSLTITPVGAAPALVATQQPAAAATLSSPDSPDRQHCSSTTQSEGIHMLSTVSDVSDLVNTPSFAGAKSFFLGGRRHFSPSIKKDCLETPISTAGNPIPPSSKTSSFPPNFSLSYLLSTHFLATLGRL